MFVVLVFVYVRANDGSKNTFVGTAGTPPGKADKAAEGSVWLREMTATRWTIKERWLCLVGSDSYDADEWGVSIKVFIILSRPWRYVKKFLVFEGRNPMFSGWGVLIRQKVLSRQQMMTETKLFSFYFSILKELYLHVIICTPWSIFGGFSVPTLATTPTHTTFTPSPTQLHTYTPTPEHTGKQTV